MPPRAPAFRTPLSTLSTLATIVAVASAGSVAACREPQANTVAAPIPPASTPPPLREPAPTETPLAATTAAPGGNPAGEDAGTAPAASAVPPKVGRGPDARRIARAADAALARAARCPVDRALMGRTFPVTVTATPDGRLRAAVHAIDLNPPDAPDGLLATPPRGCIDEQFEVETVPAFDGAPVVLERKLTPRR